MIDVLMNRGSGAGDKERTRELLLELLRAHDPDATVTFVPPDQLGRVAKERVQAGKMVAAAGGDGTVAAVAATMADTGAPMGVLPLGTFNYFARDLGIPLDIEEATRVLCAGHVVSRSIGDVNGRLFLSNASIGIYPLALDERERVYERFGRSRAIAYAALARSVIRSWRRFRLDMMVDGRHMVRRTPLLFVANNRYQIDSFGLPGDTCLGSGSFAVYMTPIATRLALLELSLKALVGSIRRSPELDVTCAREISVEMRGRRLRVAADGEVLYVAPPVRFRLRSGALKVVAPAPET